MNSEWQDGTTGTLGVLMSDVQPEAVCWLWQGRIPLGKITVLDGDPSLGKSTITLDIAARVSRGLVMPDGEIGISGGVVLAGAEDGLADTVRPRLEAAGADCNRILALRPEQFASLSQLETLRAAIARVKAKLVIVDPIMAYLPAEANSWRDQDVRRVLAPLAALADETGAAILLVRHLRKSADANPLYRGGGSIGIIGAARSGLLVARDPDDPERRVFALTKSNLAREAHSLGYRLVDGNGSPRIEWLGVSNHSAAALLSPAFGSDHGALEEAQDWLRARLADGPVESKKVEQDAMANCITGATLRRAKERLAVRSLKLGMTGRWQWSLPGGAQGTEDAQYSEMTNFEPGPANRGDSPKMLRPSDIVHLQLVEPDVTLDARLIEAGSDAPAAPQRLPGGWGAGWGGWLGCSDSAEGGSKFDGPQR